MSEENKALVRRFYEEAFVKGNVAALDALSAADFIDHSPMPGQPPGVAGMKQMVSQFQAAFGDIKVTIAALVAENDLVASHFSFTATHKGSFMGEAPTGKTVTFHGLDLIRVKDGKTAEAWHYGDEITVMAQLGVKMPI